ncbi:MAG: FAD-binding protein, partial [Pseudomonadales bacterium]
MLILPRHDLSQLNTLGLACTARAWCQIQSTEALVDALQWADAQQLPVVVLGQGSNVLLPPVLDALVLQIAIPACQVIGRDGDRVRVKVGAGENWHQLVEKTLKMGCFGLENLALIPGLAGAAPVQNIGAYGVELADFVSSVTCLNRLTLETAELSRQQCTFAYRDSFFKSDAG